jgi:hypothetical protein
MHHTNIITFVHLNDHHLFLVISSLDFKLNFKEHFLEQACWPLHFSTHKSFNRSLYCPSAYQIQLGFFFNLGKKSKLALGMGPIVGLRYAQ